MMKETTNYVLSDAVQTLRFFQRSQHTQTESISLKVKFKYFIYIYIIIIII